jgi:NAD(P)-dependent dehydrogenase (short-subunit alcohol dehydrogenase family)
MSTLRGRKSLLFLGRTAIITGGGGALGRAYALELASRGCSVVVNDVGGSLTGDASSSSSSNATTENPAEAVVRQIIAGGGRAMVNFDSVVDAEKIVEAALKKFGACDILINNAGILGTSRSLR